MEHSPDLLRYVLTFPKLNSTALLNRKNLKGMTALHLAAGNSSKQEQIESLVKAGADINLASDSGHTALDITYRTLERLRTAIEQGTWLGQSHDFFSHRTNEIHGLTRAIGIDAEQENASLPQMETIDDERPEEGDHRQHSSSSDEEKETDNDEDDDPEPTTVRQHQLTNLPTELQYWDETINLLERRGAKQTASMPVPDGLLSLD
jgi:hypothetical protein